MAFDKYCKECKRNHYTVEVFDKEYNKLEVELIAFYGYDSSTGNHLQLMVSEVISTFSNEDLHYMKFLLGEKLKYGGDTVTEMRKYYELLDKIEKALEKNSVNQ